MMTTTATATSAHAIRMRRGTAETGAGVAVTAPSSQASGSARLAEWPGVPPLADLADAIRSAPARLGGVRLVCVDGPAGSGKTTLADRLAGTLGPDAAVLHLEDLYAGWTLTGAVARLAAGVLRPLAEGRPGAYHRYDWATARFVAEPVPVPVPGVLVVEGCGSAPRALDPWATLRIWVEAPPALRLARGLARDGAGMTAEWHRWQATEAAAFAAEDTAARADVAVDGAAGIAPDGTFSLVRPAPRVLGPTSRAAVTRAPRTARTMDP
jgi:energy-coupling factor transporter ATP-binding protein EcfA2